MWIAGGLNIVIGSQSRSWISVISPLVFTVVSLIVSACDAPDVSPTTSSEDVKKAGKKTKPDSVELPAESTNAPPDPCSGVPKSGKCVAQDKVATCVAPTGQGSPKVVTQQCAAHEECSVHGTGHARCVPRDGRCDPGAEECVDANSARFCDANGTWQPTTCAGCATKASRVTCPSTVATATHHGRVEYELRGPNASFTDWDAQSQMVPAQEALVLSFIKTADGNFVAIDAATTTPTGEYDIKVAAAPGPEDAIDVFAVKASNKGLDYAVASPDIPDGTWDVDKPIPSSANDRGGFWGWEQLVQGLANNSVLSITENDGSGAMRVFDYLRFAHEATKEVAGATDNRLVIWLRQNSDFNCGACFFSLPATFEGFRFESQLVRGATADRDYWSDAVTAHELGHWVMEAYGVSPEEGGPHTLSCPTLPGQAWSEGWATGYSSLVRGDPIYADKQQGTFFWFDIDGHRYSDNATWSEPSASASLLQMMDENAVASTVWNLATRPANGDAVTPNPAIFNALKSARMTKTPFARGYTTRRWDGDGCTHEGVTDTKASAPMVADFLDALNCSGFDKNRIQAAIGSYPYPVNAPLCN